MESIVYDPDVTGLTEVLDLYQKGVRILCPVCHKDLLIIDTNELAIRHRKNQGIYCTTDPKHHYERWILKDRHQEFWCRFEERMQQHKQTSAMPPSLDEFE
jgi:uncharacterized protein YbaR (Trm112 family)